MKSFQLEQAKQQDTVLSFHGGAGSVTGSNFLVEHNGVSVLVDCGFFQGEQFADEENFKPFPYDPKEIDAVIITHGHLDHVGRLPRLVHEGFSGAVYATGPTQDLAHILFEDALSIMRGEKKAEDGLLYTEEDVKKTSSLWKTVAYHETVELGNEVSFTLKDAGHVIGSAMVVVSTGDKVITFTGDVGGGLDPLLAKTESLEETNYLVTESVYGNKKHHTADRREKLEEVVEQTVQQEGTLLIPAFSIERTQTLLAELNHLIEHGKIPKTPVFLDSPMAIKVTEVYKKHTKYFSVAAQSQIERGDDIFEFPNLTFASTVEESKAIADVPNPKIIISGSGMLNGGRIVHHGKRYLSDPTTTILFVGFQAAGTPGRKILDGAPSIELLGARVPIKANIRTIFAYSAHRDSQELLELIGTAGHSLKKVFTVLGEPQSSMFLAQRVQDYLGIEAVAPTQGQIVHL